LVQQSVLRAVVGVGSEIAVLKVQVMKVQLLLDPATTSHELELEVPDKDPVSWKEEHWGKNKQARVQSSKGENWKPAGVFVITACMARNC
jgi:hypothetical protein